LVEVEGVAQLVFKICANSVSHPVVMTDWAYKVGHEFLLHLLSHENLGSRGRGRGHHCVFGVQAAISRTSWLDSKKGPPQIISEHRLSGTMIACEPLSMSTFNSTEAHKAEASTHSQVSSSHSFGINLGGRACLLSAFGRQAEDEVGAANDEDWFEHVKGPIGWHLASLQFSSSKQC
ncbi:hypothetical protein BDN71DRAFT_1427243, partial [Pleurotus eryngii]